MLIDPLIYQHIARNMLIAPCLLGRPEANSLGGLGGNNKIIIYHHMFMAWKYNLIPGTVKQIVIWQVCILTSQQL